MSNLFLQGHESPNHIPSCIYLQFHQGPNTSTGPLISSGSLLKYKAFPATYMTFVHQKIQLVLYRFCALRESGLFIVSILKVIKKYCLPVWSLLKEPYDFIHRKKYVSDLEKCARKPECQMPGHLTLHRIAYVSCISSWDRAQALKSEDQIICSLNRLLCGENGRLAQVMVWDYSLFCNPQQRTLYIIAQCPSSTQRQLWIKFLTLAI